MSFTITPHGRTLVIGDKEFPADQATPETDPAVIAVARKQPEVTIIEVKPTRASAGPEKG